MNKAGGVSVRLGARQLTRRFGAVVANEAIDFAVAPRTIHAIVGGNGAGKSTLMRILQGVDQPDAGTVVLNDEAVRLKGPADAYARGVGMVHQEFMLAPPLTLLENLILAREPIGRDRLIDWRAARADAERLTAVAGVAIDWNAKVADAPVHARQILEILRLLYRGADVLILDEPTAVLAPAQVTELIALLRRLRAEGRTIVFISHKLDEVMAVADTITVMRAGRVVATTTPSSTTRGELADLMIGDIATAAPTPARPRAAASPVFAASGLTARDSGGAARLGPIDIEVHAGEIVGIAGVAGNGQDELVACAAGLRQAEAGEIAFGSTLLTNASTRGFRAAGIGYVSADRAEEGLCLTASIRDNFIAGREQLRPFSRAGWLSFCQIGARAREALARFNVRHGRVTDPAGSLSGGNQQRLVMARELDRAPKFLVVAQPTRGVDIAGIAFIHAELSAFRDQGGAVLLVSEELDEILALSDRIVGLYRGAIVGSLQRAEATQEKVGRMMLGQRAA